MNDETKRELKERAFVDTVAISFPLPASYIPLLRKMGFGILRKSGYVKKVEGISYVYYPELPASPTATRKNPASALPN